MPVRRVAGLVFLFAITSAPAAEPSEGDLAQFERDVRPVLVEHCCRCHSGETKAPKAGLRVDGRAALLAGGDNGPAVVPGKPDESRLIEAVRYANADIAMPPKGKLTEKQIAALEQWVKAGAAWPAETSATDGPRKDLDLAKRRGEHWVWKPIVKPAVPTGTGSSVDAFLAAKRAEMKIPAVGPAAKAVWLRRVSFALTGLPPTPAEVATFEADTSANAHASVVDRLLASPAFGERWARHWLDLVRYAESRGHEFEPDIPNAYQYRDYVIRAFNADVPYDRFVREQIAGDVLPNPRMHPKTEGNESVLGTGFWHLGEEVHSPVDIRQDQADRLDNRIDVLTKTFLGLTVSCARCHDHKFDAITAKDYYALYGLLEGSAYRQVRFDGQARNRAVAADLAKLRAEVSEAFAAAHPSKPNPAVPSAAYQAWRKAAKPVLDFAEPNAKFQPDDVTFGSGPRPAGFVSLAPDDKTRMEDRPAAVFDRFWADLKIAPQSARDFGPLGKAARAGLSIRTDSFVLERKSLWYLVRGGGSAFASVEGHTVLSGPLHGTTAHPFPNAAGYRWVKHSLDGYQGRRVHVELTADPKTEFAAAAVVQADEAPPEVPPAAVLPGDTPSERFAANWEVRQAKAEAELRGRAVWESRLALALWDGNPVASPVFVRGSPRSLGEVAPNRNLEALAGPDALAPAVGSGRLEYANQLFDPERRTFVARVYVNRVWHHLFGRGLVPSTDNLGVLGEAPTHPELLDHLAVSFIENGWSTKALIRELCLTDAYRRGSTPDPAAEALDPTNRAIHAFRTTRLDGEAIRDAMLRVSGRLDPSLGGRSVPIFLTPFLDGRGRPNGGPLDGDGRRSIYLAVRRNFLSPFHLAFDTPSPFSTVGRRQSSNVPAQALILLNDPFVHQQAERWGKAVHAASGTVAERVRGMYLAAFARPPTDAESAAVVEFLARREDDGAAWAEVAHALFNVKEFVFVR